MSMIYEMRTYTCRVGKLPLALKQFEEMLPIWERLGIRQAGVWTVAVGECNQCMHYMIAWESYAERDTKWTAFLNDAEWIKRHEAMSASEADIYQFTSNCILIPTSFSAVR
jgi:hypothetical protein